MCLANAEWDFNIFLSIPFHLFYDVFSAHKIMRLKHLKNIEIYFLRLGIKKNNYFNKYKNLIRHNLHTFSSSHHIINISKLSRLKRNDLSHEFNATLMSNFLRGISWIIIWLIDNLHDSFHSFSLSFIRTLVWRLRV